MIPPDKRVSEYLTRCEQKQCFAWNDGHCTVLTEAFPNYCPFFKTADEVRKQRMVLAKKRERKKAKKDDAPGTT